MQPDRSITFDPAENSPMDCQFLLSQLVVPRPIAMVSTRSPDGITNIAPMSYYLPITGDPMLVGITMGLREDGGLKHTYQNVMASGDFVINVTTEVFRDQIEVVAMEGPADSDEFALAGWTPVPATKVTSPTIGEAVARLECEVHLVIAEVVWVTYDNAICNERGRIDPAPRRHRQAWPALVPAYRRRGYVLPAPRPVGRVRRRAGRQRGRALSGTALAAAHAGSRASPDA